MGHRVLFLWTRCPSSYLFDLRFSLYCQTVYTLPHLSPSILVEVAIRVLDQLCICLQIKAIKNDVARLPHQLLGLTYDVNDRIGRCFDEDSIMNGTTNRDPGLGRQTARQPQHLGPIGLHGKVAK